MNTNLTFDEWFARYPNSPQCENIARAAWDECSSIYQKRIQQLITENQELLETLDQWPADQTTIEFEGNIYHCRDGKVLTYENGEAIPASVCLCHAKSNSECCCGAWDCERY